MEEVLSTCEVYELLDLCVAKLKSKYFYFFDPSDKIMDPDVIHLIMLLSKLSVELKHRCDIPFDYD